MLDPIDFAFITGLIASIALLATGIALCLRCDERNSEAPADWLTYCRAIDDARRNAT